jgi:hypothetical protein
MTSTSSFSSYPSRFSGTINSPFPLVSVDKMPLPVTARGSAEVPRAAVPGLTLFCEILYVILRSKKKYQ